MELDRNMKAGILSQVTPILASVGAVAIVGAAAAVLAQLSAVNYKSSAMTGDTEIHPTGNAVNISKVETSAKDTDASLAKDEATAKDGDLSAMRTDAAASNGEATAMDSGAAAARTKAGAADIETKGLKMT
jgi:hypothetical protein